MVKTQLEYAYQVWSPIIEKDILKLQIIHRRATKIPSKLKNMSYEDKLKTLELVKLEDRRKKGDL